MAETTMNIAGDFAGLVARFLAEAQTEIIVFVVAMIAHAILFRSRSPFPNAKSVSKSTGGHDKACSMEAPAPASRVRQARSAGLVRTAEQLISEGASSEAIAAALGGLLPVSEPEQSIDLLVGLLQHTGKTANAALPSAVQLVLREKGLKLNEKLGEQLLRIFFRLHLDTEFNEVLTEIKAVMGDAYVPSSSVLGMQAAKNEAAKVTFIKDCGSQKRLKEAETFFESCTEKSCCLFNALLDACIECHDNAAADRVLKSAVAAGQADVVTYNTFLKIHARSGDFRQARAAVDSMRNAGVKPTIVTFNELLDASCMQRTAEMWKIIDEIRASGFQPNQVTCSILLKGIQSKSKAADVEQTMAIFNEVDGIDEVLLSAAVEALIRNGRADLLLPLLRQQRTSKKMILSSPKAYGSIIRAYGFVHDINGAWSMWRDMKAQGIAPSSITIGVMVECLVLNGDIDAGYNLIQEMQRDEACKELVNAVIYCSVLKGYSHQKNLARVWAVYEEMLAHKVELTIATYNTLVDACARNWEMSRLPKLLQDMSASDIKPNLITYSAILKGYCQENKIDKAYELLESMRQSTEFRPDEIMYNSLLDGCARQGMFERGITLLKDMQQDGINPSNFTLSVLVKLCNRGGHLEDAFKMCEDISKTFGFKLNVHVYTNLVHACICYRDLPRAFEVFNRMLAEGVRPVARTYKLLAEAHTRAGEPHVAAGLLRAALGLPGMPRHLEHFGTRLLQPEADRAQLAELLASLPRSH